MLDLKKIDVEEIEKARKIAKEHLKENSSEIVMVERGIGLGYDGVFLSIHEDYASYLKFKNGVSQDVFLEASSIESFLVSLSETKFRPLTFKTLAKHVLTLKEKEKE